MFEIIGVHGNIINLDHLPEEKRKESLSYEILELLEAFGPLKRQLLVKYFTDRHAVLVVECLKTMERIKKIHSYEDYFTTEEGLFDPASFSVPKENGEDNVFERTKNFQNFLYAQELRQKAFAVFLEFRQFGAVRWYLGNNYMTPWLILSFVARDKFFHVVYIKDFNELYVHDMAANPLEVRDRLALIESEEDKKQLIEHEVKGIKAYVKVDENYKATVKKP